MRNEATLYFVLTCFGDEKWSNLWFHLVSHPQNVIFPDVITNSSTGGGVSTGEEESDRQEGKGGEKCKESGRGGGPTVVWKEKFFLKIKNMNQTLLK
jgi:hypothetical protein